MKRLLLSVMILILFSSAYSQNVGIGTTTPNNSAALEIKDNSKGILIPRMTMAERNAIQNPAEGLMVYQTDDNKGFWYFNGETWTSIVSLDVFMKGGSENQTLSWCNGMPKWGSCIPILETSQPSSITSTAAVSGGNITTVVGGNPITARGVVWSVNPMPTVSLSTKTSDGTGSGVFSSNISGLSPATQYYVRAYATSSAGTGYGSQYSFTTLTSVTGPALGDVLDNNDDDSLFYRLVVTSGQLNLINDKSRTFTMFVTNNSGIKPLLVTLATQMGITLPLQAPNEVFSSFITQIPASIATALVQYNIIPQLINSTNISNTFPNSSYPSVFNPAPTLSAFARLNTYPSTRNGAWLNNIPITGVDQMASNGVIHHTAALSTPPSRYLWNRISTDPELTYLKAAILKADEGAPANQSLAGFLNSFGSNFTVFAPVDFAFRKTLTDLIAQELINNGLDPNVAIVQATQLASTPDVFNIPALAGVFPPQTVKGIVLYHVLDSRAFTNNFPTTQTAYPTLFNGVLSNHPGLKLQAVFNNPPDPFVREATVKDVYTNDPAAKIIINTNPLTTDPNGTSDQNFVNGVLHKIDKVLLPQ